MIGKKIVSWGIMIAIGISLGIGTNRSVQAEDQGFSVDATAAIAVDADSGKIFYEKDAVTPHYIASTTKLVTMYLVYDQVKQGKLNWTDTVKVSNQVAEVSRNTMLSNVPLYEDAEYSVKDLVYAGFLESANAAVMALAEKISGSEPKFTDQMRDQLLKWGIKDAEIYNSTGLNNSFLDEKFRYPESSEEAENKMSAKDMAIVARHLIKDFPEVLAVTATPSALFPEPNGLNQVIESTNYMLPGRPYFMAGVDGLKTGTTELAGANFVGTVKKGEIRLITVMFDVTNGVYNMGARFIQTGALMDHVYDTWHMQTVVDTHTPVANTQTLPVKKGKQEQAKLVYSDPIQLWVKNDMDAKQLKIKSTVSSNRTLEAPVAKKQEVGTATIELAQDHLGYLDSNVKHQTIIVTDSEVEKEHFIVRIWKSVVTLFS